VTFGNRSTQRRAGTAGMARLERAQTAVGVLLVACGVAMMCLAAVQVAAPAAPLRLPPPAALRASSQQRVALAMMAVPPSGCARVWRRRAARGYQRHAWAGACG